MTTKEILKSINEEGGFNNWRNWSAKDCAEWIKANYDCSHYVANNVGRIIKNNY